MRRDVGDEGLKLRLEAPLDLMTFDLANVG